MIAGLLGVHLLSRGTVWGWYWMVLSRMTVNKHLVIFFREMDRV